MKSSLITKLFVLFTVAFDPLLLSSQVNVTTWHNDIGRTGQNTSETSLTPTTVNKTGFGKICSYAVDGQVYAQPLVVTGLAIGSGHPVEYVVTMNDKVYAFDGTNCTLLLGPKSLLQGSEIAAQCGDVGGGGCLTFKPTIGILGTPVIDPGTNIMYLVAWSEITGSPNTFVHRIHALDITNLNEVANGPVAISATVGSASFTSSDHIQRPRLLLLSGSPSVVYVAFSMMDGAPGLPKGWVLGYNASNLTDTNYPLKFPTTPNGSGGGVWQGGAGLAAGKDSSGTTYIYFGTGNGTFDQNVGHTACVDCGDSFVKLTTGTPTVANFFAPFDAFCRNACNADVDFGSGGVTLIPDNTLPSPYAYLAVMADKSKSIWVMDRTSPGRFGGSNSGSCPTPTCSGTNANVETIPRSNQYHNTPAYWNQRLYYAAINESLTSYQVASQCPFGDLYGPPVCVSGPGQSPSSSVTFPYGVTPSVSASGSSGGVVWSIWQDGNASGGSKAILYAFSSDLSTDLFDSTMCTNNVDALDPGTKFSVPTIANGYVYVGTQGNFNIFGLITGKTCTG